MVTLFLVCSHGPSQLPCCCGVGASPVAFSSAWPSVDPAYPNRLGYLQSVFALVRVGCLQLVFSLIALVGFIFPMLGWLRLFPRFLPSRCREEIRQRCENHIKMKTKYKVIITTDFVLRIFGLRISYYVTKNPSKINK